MSAGAPPPVPWLYNQDSSNGQQSSGSPGHAASNLPVPSIAAAPKSLKLSALSAGDVLPPGSTCASSLSTTPRPLSQAREPRLFKSVFDAKNKSELWIATGAWTKALLRARKILPDLTVYEGPRSAWRFHVPNPYAVTLPSSPTDWETQGCPLFFPGCNCIAGNAAYVPIYHSANERGSKYLEYAKNMAYIPSVVPRAPSIPRIRVELAPGIPPTPQAPRPTKATLIQDKTSVSGSKGLASVPADHESAPPVQAQHNHPAVYASLVERIENSLGSGSLAPEHPSQESPPPQPGYPSRALSPPRQARQAYPAPGYHFPSPASYSSPDFILPLQLPRGYRGPGYPAPGHSIPTEPGYPAAPSYALPTHLGCPLPGYPLPGYPSPHYTSPGHHSSGYPGFADPSSGYRSHITQSTAARPSASAIFTPLHGSSGHKRALEAEHDDDDDDESAQPSGSDQAKKKRKQAVQGVKEDEKALIARYMKMEIDAENRTESKWQNVSGKLWTNHGIQRSGNSVKAWWSRQGRQEFGIDERKNPNGRKLVTSKQDPDERKRARERKKLEATEGTREKGKS